jgi:hypothetical protein
MILIRNYRFILLCLLVGIGLIGGHQKAWAGNAIKFVHIADLPQWTGDYSTLQWLNKSQYEDSPSPWHGEFPDVRLGSKVASARLWDMGFYDLPTGIQPSLPLIGGWEKVKTERKDRSCARYVLSLFHPATGRRAVWNVVFERNTIFFSRWVDTITRECFGVGEVFYINTRYIAFKTSEPGWIFFDRQDGVFLPMVVEGNPNHWINLFVSPQGEVLIEVQVDAKGSSHTTRDDRPADGIRQVTYRGKPLIAPLDARESEQAVRVYQTSHDLFVPKRQPRPVKIEQPRMAAPASPTGPPGRNPKELDSSHIAPPS